MASLALNTAQVLRNVGFERFLVGQNLVADAAGRVAKVNVIVIVAVYSRTVRLVAQAANETPVTFVNLLGLSGRPSSDRLDPRIACKFQAAR